MLLMLYYLHKECPLQSGASRARIYMVFRPRLTCLGQVRHFYFFLLFLLSRKFRNATIKPPKVHNKVNIPRNIEINSNAVIITHLPSIMYHKLVIHWLGRLPPCHGHPRTFVRVIIISPTMACVNIFTSPI